MPDRFVHVGLVVASRARAIQMVSFLPEDAAAVGVRISVFCPDGIYDSLKDVLAARGIQRFPMIQLSLKHPLGVESHLRYLTVTDFAGNKILDLFRRIDFSTSGFFLPYIVWPISRLLRLIPAFRNGAFWDSLENALFGRHPGYHALFTKERFDWVAFPAPVLRTPTELELLLAARRHGVKTAAIDEAFGQFVNQPVTFRAFDRIFVWNEQTKEDARTYRGLSTDHIVVSGPYRFDAYFRDHTPSREAFCAAHGLTPQKKIIACALAGVDEEFELIDRILARMDAGEFREPVQLLVRLSPFGRQTADYAERYAGRAGIVLHDPRDEVSYPGFDELQSQMVDLAGLLKHSGIVLSHVSTLAVEAAAFGTPALYHLLPEIEGTTPQSEARRLEALRRQDCDQWPFIRYVTDTGAVPVVRSVEELMREIDRALAHPDALTKERAALLSKICTYTDGQSGTRIMDALIA